MNCEPAFWILFAAALVGIPAFAGLGYLCGWRDATARALGREETT